MKVLLIDYQFKDFAYCDKETEYLQNVKKAIQYVQNKNNLRDPKRKYRKKYSMELLTLASYLKKYGIEIFYLSIPQDMGKFECHITDSDAVYFLSDTSSYPNVSELIRHVKRNYSAKTILGGYHAFGLSERILNELPELDYVVIGESEKTILELLQGVEVKKIKGIAYRTNDSVVMSKLVRNVENYEIPKADYSFLNGNKLMYRFALQTTRGCPYKCHYCIYGFYHESIRNKSIDNIKNELIQIREICGAELDMHILDNIVAYDIESAKKLSSIIRELDMKINFSADIRPEYLQNLTRIRVLEEIGVKKIFLGFEDAEEDCRLNASRNMDEKLFLDSLYTLKKHSNIQVECYWMMGMPGTTVESFDKNIKFAVRLIEEGLIESICTDTTYVPQPGTPMYDYAENYGIHLEEIDWKLYQRSNYLPVFSLDSISRIEVMRGLIRFDKAIIAAQLKVMEMTEEDVLAIYFDWINNND